MKKLQLFLMAILMLLGSTVSRAAEMYAVLNNNTLTFYYDNSKASRSGTKYSMNKTGNAPNWYNKTSITSVVFDASFAGARPSTCYGWFYGLTGLKTITGIGNLNTSSAESMYAMFNKCSNLTSLDVSGFNTANVTNMSYMFNGCSGVKTLDVSKFNTAKVTTFEGMFQNCTGVTSLDISSFTLTSSQTTTIMINKCSGLKSLTIPSTANVLDGQACSGIGTQSAPCALNFPSGFTPSKTYTGSGWYLWKNGYFKDGTTPTPSTTEAYAVLSGSTLTFYYDDKKSSRSGTKYSLNTGANAPGWNSSATSITKVVFNSSFANAKSTSCYQWFYNMSNLTTITGIEYLKTVSVTNMRSMFQGCTKLTSLDLSTFDTQNVTTMYRMFYNCTGLKALTLDNGGSNMGEYVEYHSTFVTKKATTLQEMFYGCKNLKELILADFTVTSSTNTTSMLKECSGLEMLYFSNDMEALDANACEGVGSPSNPCMLTNPGHIPQGSYCIENGQLYLLWKKGCFVDGVHSAYTRLQDGVLTFYYGIRYLFGDDFSLNEGSTAPEWLDYASQVKTVVFSEDFKYAAPTTAYAWFRDMYNLTSIKGLENLNKDYLKNLSYMLSGCSSLTSLDLSDFYFTHYVYKTEALSYNEFSETKYMLKGCSGLQSLKLCFYANNLDNTACSGVGTASKPCSLDFTGSIEGASNHGSYFIWKSGYFKSNSTIIPDEEKPYAVLDGSTLTFYYDDSYNTRSGTVYDLNTGSDAPGWNSKATSITKVVFNSNFEDARPESCYRWFNGMSKLTSITGIEYLNTEDVTNMTSMFNGCSVLTSLDVSNFDTSSVKDMSYMFNGCSKLNFINFALSVSVAPNGYPSYYSSFGTKAVTNLRNMFSGCSSLTSLELPEFEITSSKNSTEMFKGCSALQQLHIQGNYSGINASAFSGVGTTSKPCELEFADATIDGVTTRTPTYFQWKAGYFKDYRTAFAVYMEDSQTLTFYFDVNEGSFISVMHDYNLNEGSSAPGWLEFASNVKTVRFSEGFKDARPTSCYQWLYNVSNITKIEGLENLNTEYATNMASMFNGCKKLTSLDLSKFTFTSSSNTKLLANGCSALKTLTVPSTAGYLAADACKGVGTASAPITLNYPSGFTPEKTSTGNGYFVWKSGYFKETGTNPPTPPTDGEMYAVLSNNKLTFYYDYNKSSRTGTKYSMNVTGNAPKWYNNTSITEVEFDASFAGARPTTCYGWFFGLEGLKTITGIGNLNTEKVENMYAMFHNCSKLTSLDVNGFNTANVTNMSYMFNNCSGVTTLNVSKFNTAKVTNFEGMFQNCTGVTSLDISSFTLTSSQNTKIMINKCSGLKTLIIPSTANVLDGQACSGIGTQSAPCTLIHASGFTPDKTYTGNGWYLWKNGYFKSATRYLGDVNIDGVIDVTDVMCIVDYVLSKPLKVFSAINAEMNSDGSIDITDAMMIVDIILNKPSSVAAATSISHSDMMYVTGRGSELDLHLKGNNAYKAAEMTLVLPEECSLSEAEMNPIRTDGHNVIINSLGNGIYRIVVLSVTGREFCPNGTAIIHLTIDGDHHDKVVVSDVVMTSSDLESVSINCVPGITTGISGINSDNTDGEWYNIQGQRVATPQHGIYIRNGRKYSVK